MKVANFVLALGFAVSYSLKLNAQISQNCDYSRAEESKLVELSKTDKNPEIDPVCAGKLSFFEAASNLEKTRALPPQQGVILAGVAIEKLGAVRNVWAMEKMSSTKFNENQLVTWGQILNLYKTKMNLYFSAQDKKNDIQINSPEKFVFLGNTLNKDVIDAKDDWTIFGYKIPVENIANHIMVTSH